MRNDVGIENVIEALTPEDSLMTVATKIGRLCLDNKRAIAMDSYPQRSDLVTDWSNELAAELNKWWTKEGYPIAGSTGEVANIISRLILTPDLAYRVAIVALCQGPLTTFFNSTYEIVELTRGSVFPLPTRSLSWPTKTPHPVDTTHRDPLCPPPFQIWGSGQVVRLNYEHRSLLDDVCWRRVETTAGTISYSLPKVGAVLPFSTDEMHVPPVDAKKETVFGVRPHPHGASAAGLDGAVLERVYGALNSARSGDSEPDIAVLPECSLHKADLLDQLGQEAWNQLSPVVVAGSAHETVDGYNRNRSITYLHGAKLIVHDKRVPFRNHNLIEDIDSLTSEPVTIACGSATRLGVAICADLNTLELVTIYAALGVNLLFVPAWTPKEGTFSGALGAVASYCQCVSMVANGPQQHSWRDADWFYALSIVPRGQPRVAVHTPQQGSQPLAGILDPNIPPDAAGSWTWVPA